MKNLLLTLTLSLVLLFSAVGCDYLEEKNITNPPSSTQNSSSQPAESAPSQSVPNESVTPSSQTAPQNQQNTTISRDEAKRIALENAGVAENAVFDYEAELDYERGVLTYEISFESKEFEYDYDINATDGAIIKSEKEPNDIY